ncbi:TonB-dependent receptor [Geothrix sp. PMB-07]|uniref:TonB-dependent receptor n=1 Tax=Geothrix sp. PMB-07 TaxID=3068640 RepID=UPI0027429156|nr:TonB-dependent receptor [Geothrix sp. PMB-07]WLT30677.1 TonB-dependent receptor [Geothrix sp. PMB-07]
MQNRSRFTPILLSLVAASLMAQETTGSVTGRVTSKAGQPLPGTVIRITSPNLLGDRTTVADSNGQFRIPILPGGQYTLTATLKDYATSKGTFQILAGQTSKADAVLTPVSDILKVQQATVEVISAATQVDKTETVTQTNMAIEEINQLMSNNLQAVTYLAPGIANAGGSPRIRGGSGNGTKWLLNGAMVNDQAWGYDLGDVTIQDMVESVAVIQSPLNARYGNTDSGLISMTTVKGTNTFSGSLRAKYRLGDSDGNNSLNATPVAYPNRLGQSSAPVPIADAAFRTYDIVFRGPIWKDHITFAFGGTYTPTSPSTSRMDRLISDPALSTDKAGTYFKLPNGSVLRRANTYNQAGLEPVTSKSTYNQFVLFYQITANHQLEWNYTQNDSRNTWYGYNPISPAGGGPDGLTTRVWDLAYKGIIGNSGVLEARFGRTMRWWPHPVTSTDPIQIQYGETSIPRPNGTFVANSIYDLSKGHIAKWTNGATSDRGDVFYDDTLVINYEHVLNINGSSHLIDVGLEKQKFQWQTQTLTQMPPRNYYVPGQLATDYTQAEVGAGYTPGDVNGKYIVMNWQATNADAGGVGNTTLWNSGKAYLIPTFREFTGQAEGTYYQPTTSLYINDQWTINQNHSVMLGVRGDRMQVQDSRGTIFSYNQITPRFEYKWDVFGDQSRVMNVSYGQFHNRVPGGQFQKYVLTRLPYDTTYYWTGTNPNPATPNAPYLVDKSALLNPANYTHVAAFSGPGTFALDPSWKAPVATEYTVGLRRSYASGMSWRTSAIYKTWKNLYDAFPEYTTSQLTQPGTSLSKPIYRRITRNDPDAVKTYKGVEMEWSIPFTQKLRFAGNYTYARTMTNASTLNDSPSSNRSPVGNFRNYFDTLYARDMYQPIKLQDPEHNAKAWFVYDLSRPKVKSSISFRANYTSGTPDYRTTTMEVGAPNSYYGATVPPGLPHTVGLITPGFTTEAVYTTSLKYDVEVELKRGIRMFASIEVNNPFNVRMSGTSDPNVAGGWNGVSAYGDNTEVKGSPNYLTHGWRANSDLSDSGVGSSRNLPRSFTLEAGLRF